MIWNILTDSGFLCSFRCLCTTPFQTTAVSFSADNSRLPSKRQRSIKDFMNTTEDSFWIELSQDTSTLLPEDL